MLRALARRIAPLVLAAALPAHAELAAQFPAGSIRTREDATRALAAARTEAAAVEEAYAAEQQRCAQAFFVNRCQDEARRTRELALREVRRVELEARDTQRRLDAEERARRRAQQPA
ncbi:MAG: hypothetical protein L6Q72_04275, partial [Burkholderiaceae bacterium]|nr:hypothetical protein [Burkholderiaceae bacterium]